MCKALECSFACGLGDEWQRLENMLELLGRQSVEMRDDGLELRVFGTCFDVGGCCQQLCDPIKAIEGRMLGTDARDRKP